jgi:hypothetical protein
LLGVPRVGVPAPGVIVGTAAVPGDGRCGDTALIAGDEVSAGVASRCKPEYSDDWDVSSSEDMPAATAHAAAEVDEEKYIEGFDAVDAFRPLVPFTPFMPFTPLRPVRPVADWIDLRDRAVADDRVGDFASSGVGVVERAPGMGMDAERAAALELLAELVGAGSGRVGVAVDMPVRPIPVPALVRVTSVVDAYGGDRVDTGIRLLATGGESGRGGGAFFGVLPSARDSALLEGRNRSSSGSPPKNPPPPRPRQPGDAPGAQGSVSSDSTTGAVGVCSAAHISRVRHG